MSSQEEGEIVVRTEKAEKIRQAPGRDGPGKPSLSFQHQGKGRASYGWDLHSYVQISDAHRVLSLRTYIGMLW